MARVAILMLIITHAVAGTAAAVTAHVIGSVSATRVSLGQSFTVKTTLEINDRTAEQVRIAVSFPGFTEPGSRGTSYSSRQATVATESLSVGGRHYYVDGISDSSLLPGPNDASSAAGNLWVQSDWIGTGSNNARSLYLTVTPHIASSVKVRVIFWLGNERNPLRSDELYERANLNTYEFAVTVEDEARHCVTWWDSNLPILLDTEFSCKESYQETALVQVGYLTDATGPAHDKASNDEYIS